MALTADRLETGYPGAESVVRQVYLDLPRGRFLCLLGPNGTGKSTLLRAMAGLLPLRAGRLTVDGVPLHTLSAPARARRIGFLPQDVHPAFPFRVDEAVALGARVAGRGHWFDTRPSEEARNSVAAALRAVDAVHLAHRDLGTLSGGEFRRVLVASVLAQEPDYLLLDEPAAMLDLHHQAELFKMLRRLAREDLGVLCVTHDFNLAAAFADELVLLHEGQVLVRGPASDVLADQHLSTLFGEHYALFPRDGAPPVVTPQ